MDTCRHCGREIEQKCDPSMDGNHFFWWVHVPGGFTICVPDRTKAEPCD